MARVMEIWKGGTGQRLRFSGDAIEEFWPFGRKIWLIHTTSASARAGVSMPSWLLINVIFSLGNILFSTVISIRVVTPTLSNTIIINLNVMIMANNRFITLHHKVGNFHTKSIQNRFMKWGRQNKRLNNYFIVPVS